MPNYVMPGVRATPRTALRAGTFALVALVIAVLAWNGYRAVTRPDPFRIRLSTTQIGDGIIVGTDVRLEGVPVGRITDITPGERGHQVLTLDLDRSQLSGLTDRLTVQYAPANLFGISTLTLRRAAGGAPLHDGAMIDLSATGAVVDATMGSLLRGLGATSGEVLTPEFAEAIRQVDSGLTAFAPLLEAVVMLGRTVADTQRYAPSYLIERYGAILAGAGTLTSSTFKLLDGVVSIEVLKNDRPLYDAAISMIAGQVFPAVAQIGDAGRSHLTGYLEMLTPLLEAVAHTVPTPGRSAAETTELLDRLHRAFADTPDGPVLGLDITVRAMPGLAVPLLGLPAGEGNR
ncbi:MlaD family protein [Nocardia sp. NPDC127526]|uniref:MlaD family protein n=1 Tax=Nocardia sp. NPDC127526 TaxID=3345393 RepID=UPI00362FEF89